MPSHTSPGTAAWPMGPNDWLQFGLLWSLALAALAVAIVVLDRIDARTQPATRIGSGWA